MSARVWLAWAVIALVACDGGGSGFPDAGGADGALPRRDGGPLPPPPMLDCELSGDSASPAWGAAPSGGRDVACFEIRNDLDVPRVGEVAYSSVPIARGLDLRDTDGLVVVGPLGIVPAQLDVVARWGAVVDDVAAPIRWLQVSLPADIGSRSVGRYALRRVESFSPPDDPDAARIVEDAASVVVETGLARFTLDPTYPGLLRSIDIDGERITAPDRLGPRLVLGDGTAIGAGGAGGSVVLDGPMEILERGPVRVAVAQRGHFVGAGGRTRCSAGPEPYEPYGYTLVLAFDRGARHVDVQLNVRNECTDNFSGPWTDDATRFARASFELPVGATEGVWFGADGAVAAAGGDSVVVEQQRGGGIPWRRRARVVVDGAERGRGELYERPVAAASAGGLVASVQMPWMRFREPQAVAYEDGALSARVVSEELVIGEARGIWGVARFDFVRAEPSPTAALETTRARNAAALERGLLVRPTLTTVNAAEVWPSLGTDQPSLLRDAYVDWVARMHDDTVMSQWEASKTYGSQVWPDIPFNPAPVDAPGENGVEMNYWNASRTELLEYFRSGDVRYAWDWALPMTWYQFASAYSNAGEHSHGNRNGAALTSGGCGWENGCCHLPDLGPDCEVEGMDDHGHWNRTNTGSDDYAYTHGDVAYVVRPSYWMRRRFAQAGRMVLDRYPDGEPGAREIFVSARDVTRQVIQHFVLLANCAEFVPGAEGRACRDRLISFFEELARDNFSAGVVCQRDDPATDIDFSFERVPQDPTFCPAPQQFMQNALMLPFFHRIYRSWGDIGGQLRRVLVEAPFRYYQFGMGLPVSDRPTGLDDSARPAIPVSDGAIWTNAMQYRLTADRSTVASCEVAPRNQQQSLEAADDDCAIDPSTSFDEFPPDFIEDITLFPNRPHTVAWLLVADTMDERVRACSIGRAALDDEVFLSFWNDYTDGTPHGWLKGPAQMMQGMVFGLGAYETCSPR